jgi:hypothetical protein
VDSRLPGCLRGQGKKPFALAISYALGTVLGSNPIKGVIF